MSIKVRVTDEQTGDTAERTVPDGDYIVICTEPCEIGDIRMFRGGTHVVVIRGRTQP